MRRVILPMLLALSLVLAGCNGIGLGGDEMPEQTLTPAPVPTDEPTPTPVPQLAPGLTGEGVTDAFALAEAHAAILENISYTIHRNTTIQYANGTLRGRVVKTTQVARNKTRFYHIENISGPNPLLPIYNFSGPARLEQFSNGERSLIAFTRNNNTTYGVILSDTYGPTSIGEFSTLFSAVETRVTDRETRNGTTLYRIESTELVNPSVLPLGARYENVRNATLVAFVDSRGFVHEYRLNYTATLNGGPVHISQQVRYTDLGNTTVERPSWYDEAVENTSTTTPSRNRVTTVLTTAPVDHLADPERVGV